MTMAAEVFLEAPCPAHAVFTSESEEAAEEAPLTSAEGAEELDEHDLTRLQVVQRRLRHTRKLLHLYETTYW